MMCGSCTLCTSLTVRAGEERIEEEKKITMHINVVYFETIFH